MFFNLLLAAFVVSCRSQSQTTEAPSTTTQAPYLQPPRHCSLAGQICATCDTVSVCITNFDGSITTVNQTCRPDEKCIDGQCIQGALCNYRPFHCSEEGFFPDPYDCTKYHSCLPSEVDGNEDQITSQCPEGTSYDALSASCGFPLNTDACINRPVPECTERLQVGPVPSNPNIYYTCVEKDSTLAPELRRCQGGNKFKADKLSCQEESLGKKKDKKEKKEKKPKKPKE